MPLSFGEFLEQKLKFELARRGLTSSIVFSALALVIFAADIVDSSLRNYGQVTLFLLLIVNVFRGLASQKYLQDPLLNGRWLKILHVSIILNPLGWASLLAVLFYHPEGHLTSNSYLAFLITAGVSVGSTFSLAPFILQGVFFQVLVIGVGSYFTYVSHQMNPESVSVSLSVTFVVFLFYTILQTQQNKKALIQSAQYEHSLLLSNEKIQDQAVKLMQASRLTSLGEMAGGIAHEINNPLAIIFSNVEILKIELSRVLGGNTKSHERMDKITLSGMRIKNIISGLLVFSDKNEDLIKTPTEVRKIINDALDFNREKFANLGIKLNVDIDGDLSVLCNPSRTAQALLNLLNNSAEFAQKGNDKWVSIHAFAKGDNVTIEITDSGPGIATQIKPKLFQPFSTNKEVGKGVGLGLSIARGIVRGQGGDLLFDENAKHTTFKMLMQKAS